MPHHVPVLLRSAVPLQLLLEILKQMLGTFTECLQENTEHVL